MEKPRAILFEYLDKHRISYDTHYIDDSNVAFDAIVEAMEAYAKHYHEQQVNSVDLADVGESFYYRFVYHDEKGDLGYTFIKVNEDCHDLAQIEFDKKFPNFKAYRSEKVQP